MTDGRSRPDRQGEGPAHAPVGGQAAAARGALVPGPARRAVRVGGAGERGFGGRGLVRLAGPVRSRRPAFHGDNKEVLAHLLANGFRGKVDLVYIDPPFDSGADYVRKVQLRGASGSVRLDGESHTLGEQIQYTDIWANDTYLQFTVFIDAAYDGEVFTVAQANIPERRQDLVSGSYEVARSPGSGRPVAVRITDMLGEDVLVVEGR